MYKLKQNQPDFEVVDGLFAGRKYKAGQTYAEVPENEKHRFNSDSIVEDAENPPPAPSQEGTSKKKNKEENK